MFECFNIFKGKDLIVECKVLLFCEMVFKRKVMILKLEFNFLYFVLIGVFNVY